MGILGLGRKKKAAQEAAPVASVVEERSGPALMLLVPEVAGGTSFRALPFNSTGEAAAYLSTLIPAAVPRIHAFWAMMEKPGEASTGGESMVLIRSEGGGDLVYVVSFVDIESALSFARFEVKRGLSLNMLMLYWAELVSIEMDETGIRLRPESAPKAGDVPRVAAVEPEDTTAESSSTQKMTDDSAQMPERQGGATTNWVRKAPAQGEPPMIVAAPEPVAFEAPSHEPAPLPFAGPAEEPSREFTLQPEIEAAANTPEPEALEASVAAETEPAALEEPPVREFSLQPEIEPAGRAPAALEFPPEPGEVVAADDLLIEDPDLVGAGETTEPEFAPEPEDYAAEVELTEDVVAEELEAFADASDSGVTPAPETAADPGESDAGIVEFSLDPLATAAHTPVENADRVADGDTDALDATQAPEAAEDILAEGPEIALEGEAAVQGVVGMDREPAPERESPIYATEPMAVKELEAVTIELPETAVASESDTQGTETVDAPAAPRWAEEMDAVAEEAADPVEPGSEGALPAAAVVADEGPEPEQLSPDGAEDEESTTETPAPAAAAEDAGLEAEQAEEFSFGDEEPLVADAPPFLREDAGEEEADWAEEPLSPQSRYEVDVDEADGELLPPSSSQRDVEPGGERHEDISEDVIEEPELVASEEPAAEEEWAARDISIEETVAIGASGTSSNGQHEAAPNGDEPPETIPGEEDLSPEMAAFLKSRRRVSKDNPFRGFDSPPGRF